MKKKTDLLQVEYDKTEKTEKKLYIKLIYDKILSIRLIITDAAYHVLLFVTCN